MITNEKIITINRPIEEVFAYVSDIQEITFSPEVSIMCD